MTSPKSARVGPLVAIGGAEDKSRESQILRCVLDLAPKDNREVAVITTASSIPDEVYPQYEKVFTELGASAVYHLNMRSRMDAGASGNVDTVNRCGILFMSGGDQLRLTHILGGSPVLKAMRKRRSEGAVIAGTSAGAAAQSATMIYNGAAADALRKGAVKMAAGLGFVENVVIDSHFLERGRFTRLIEVGATNPEFLGIGIGEDAAVVFRNGTVLEAIGSGHVIIVDSYDLKTSNVASVNDGEPVAVEHVIIHALTSGYRYDVSSRRFLQPGLEDSDANNAQGEQTREAIANEDN